MVRRKIKDLKFVFFLVMIILSGCSKPVAPIQPDTGKIYNYTKNTRGILTSPGSMSKTNDSTVTINGIPFFKQGKDNTCGQATMASILNFWGVNISYQAIIDENNPDNMPTDLEKMESYIKSKNVNAKAYKKSSFEFLKYLINQKRPPIVLLDLGGLSNEHYVVVTGYNDLKKTIIFNDPVSGPNIQFTEQIFDDKWKNQSLTNLLIFGDKFDHAIIDVGLPE